MRRPTPKPKPTCDLMGGVTFSRWGPNFLAFLYGVYRMDEVSLCSRCGNCPEARGRAHVPLLLWGCRSASAPLRSGRDSEQVRYVPYPL